jgi:hypothetical protein
MEFDVKVRLRFVLAIGLNARRNTAPCGGEWSAAQVRSILTIGTGNMRPVASFDILEFDLFRKCHRQTFQAARVGLMDR